LSRKFVVSLLTTRIRSGTGLKSKPNAVPVRAGANGVAPTGVATPVVVLIV
jgi:hypothetical protein